VRKGSSPSRKSTSRSLRRQLTHRNAWAVVGAAITALIAYWNTRLSTSVGGLITAVVLLGIGIMILMQDPRSAPRRLRSSGLLRLPYRCLASLVCILLAVFLVVRALPAMAQGPLPAFDVKDVGLDAAEWVVSAPPPSVPNPCLDVGQWLKAVEAFNPVSTDSLWHVTLTGRQDVIVGLPTIVLDQPTQAAVKGTYVSEDKTCGRGGPDEGMLLELDLDSRHATYFVGTLQQKAPRTVSLRPSENFGLDIEGKTRNHVVWHVELPVLSKPNQRHLGVLRIPKTGSIETTGIGSSAPCVRPISYDQSFQQRYLCDGSAK